jgi:hypothetical protein
VYGNIGHATYARSSTSLESKSFLSGTILVRDSKAGVGTEFTVVQKYGKQDSGTPAVPAGEMKLARFQVPNVKNIKKAI